MEYNFENKFVETDEAIIFFDNYINIDSPKEKFVIISHLSADNLAYLQQATLPTKTFVSQNLFLHGRNTSRYLAQLKHIYFL